MSGYSALADDYSVSLSLNTEMPLPNTRETVLDFFSRVQKTYPEMRKFYTRENGDFVLEEEKDKPNCRWVALERARICSAAINPLSLDDAMTQHSLILDIAPYMLSVRPLDCEALDLMFGFDFAYRGNHDELVAEALGLPASLEPLTGLPQAKTLSYEPGLTISLDESCRRQCRLVVETRTNAYQVRKNEFPEEPISVYFTVRQYGSLPHDASLTSTMHELRQVGEEIINDYVIAQVLRPLAQAISSR